MHRIFLILLVIINVTSEAVGQIKVDTQFVALGDSQVKLIIYTSNLKSTIAYAHVHENEVASLQAGIEMIKKYGGKIVSLSHSPHGQTNRNVTFQYKGRKYQFDPNRIYTQDDNKLKSNIIAISSNDKIDGLIMEMVRNLAMKIWNHVEYASTVVALHNNRNAPPTVKRKWFKLDSIDPESYNITSYVLKCDHTSESNQSCSDIYINSAMNNSEFFIVTKQSDFAELSQKRHTVVLQNSTPIDDGSMSVWAYKHNKRYINTEAKHGRVAQQSAMLEVLNTIID
jgi:hypothetical protein